MWKYVGNKKSGSIDVQRDSIWKVVADQMNLNRSGLKVWKPEKRVYLQMTQYSSISQIDCVMCSSYILGLIKLGQSLKL